MQTVLCFGDSNTWGWNPKNKERYTEQERWTGVLKYKLGQKYRIIEEGLNGRTTVWDDPFEDHKNGSKQILPCLEACHPLDLVILLLGTNDLKRHYSASVCDIANGIEVLLNIILNSGSGRNGQDPKVLLVSPPPIAHIYEHDHAFAGQGEKSARLGKKYSSIAERKGCSFINAGDYIETSALDGVHWERSEHRKLGEVIANVIPDILG